MKIINLKKFCLLNFFKFIITLMVNMRLVLDFLHARKVLLLSLWLNSAQFPRYPDLHFVHRPSGNPPNCAIGYFLPLSQSIKKPHLWWSFFMERETRLELATSSLARKHSTTELPPHFFCCIFIIHEQFFFASVFFMLPPFLPYCCPMTLCLLQFCP